jgi:predicted glycosyltransferase involved in capsule biosynthesis
MDRLGGWRDLLMPVTNNFYTVTLIHNQESTLKMLLDSYKTQSFFPGKFIFVLDRCIDNSENVLERFAEEFPVKIIKNNFGNGFMSGYCRDLGISEIHKENKNVNILFLDGDCVPSKDLFLEVSNILKTPKQTITINSRLNQSEKDSSVYLSDSRVMNPWLKDLIFVNDKNNIIKTMDLARLRMITWSCCLGMNSLTINELKNINKKLYNIERIFSPAFDGTWGGEDDFVGLSAMLFGIDVAAINPEHNVKHIWHESKSNEDFIKNSKKEYENLLELAHKKNAPGLHFSKTDVQSYSRKYFENLQKGYL